ncbi:helix-turn-helix transcriptional regulator [Dickeya dianthicola]|uniref:helix-turn-helix transcriptional regulator n=1 Tax=Dickeya dianthicola TaxID=204039 RepID=UPI00136A24A2|nr:helix-turn-helix transcriptional regulator [Dickeya dianthicola]MCI4188014.1 helix-turn-helix domain-containing protein [Dickeya dianthicola]MCI4236730.1 helix-turn-helix domain-containing protein [Dickeya dianthicola]MCI4255042.1 helix-turn-helix domain-containing protein [Dickeya dianthicola]MZG21544.1 helix-turn-helix transcriptional regulator [Dickeya dianthicola]MZI90522.1 helix-turn-helix transcriptional regulator [Dickeya dianthicola]
MSQDRNNTGVYAGVDDVQETIRKLRQRVQERNVALEHIQFAPVITTAAPADIPKARASKNSRPLNASERTSAMQTIIRRMMLGEMSQGNALRELRLTVLGLKQDAYGRLVGVSRKTLSEIENDKGNYTADIINKVFKPFGLKMGLIPVSPSLLAEILSTAPTAGAQSDSR